MDALSTLTDIRDYVIIVVGILGIVALLVFTLITALVGLTVWGLLKSARGTVTDGVGPVLKNAQETMKTVQGTVSFFSDAVAAPVIKVYGVIGGVRKAAGVMSRGRGRGS